uniref:Uncharacterized protein n=1 Tax=Rhizophora mucronata TaxID=61149 RepID=A0A2P2NP16_RHIMU
MSLKLKKYLYSLILYLAYMVSLFFSVHLVYCPCNSENFLGEILEYEAHPFLFSLSSSF